MDLMLKTGNVANFKDSTLRYLNLVNITNIKRIKKSLNHLEIGSFWFEHMNCYTSTIERPNG